MRRLVAAAAAVALFGAVAVVSAAAPSDAPVESYVVQSGDGFYKIADTLAPDADRDVAAEYLARANGMTLGSALHPGRVLWFAPSAVELASATTTTAAPTTTTTAAPTTTTTVPPATTTAPPSAGFFEDFNGNPDALDRFASGVFHRDNVLVAQQQWQADHRLLGGGDCTPPTETHTVYRTDPAGSVYVCSSVAGDPSKGHIMTSVGDTSGYSIAWFSPDADGNGNPDVFQGADTDVISWDVNVTDLKARQWWEIAIVDAGAPFLTTLDWMAQTANIEPYHESTIAVGKGPFGNDANITTEGSYRDPLGWQHVCGQFAADPEGCASKMIRRPFSITDNHDGTMTFLYLGRTFTYPGELPDEFQIYFKDHSYTPNKDGMPVGHTWHWDNIRVG